MLLPTIVGFRKDVTDHEVDDKEAEENNTELLRVDVPESHSIERRQNNAGRDFCTMLFNLKVSIRQTLEFDQRLCILLLLVCCALMLLVG